MADVVILGAGVMGAAMAVPASSRGGAVDLVGTPLDGAIVEAVAAGAPHPRLGLVLPPGVRAQGWEAFGAVMRQDVKLVVLGVSSAGVGWAIERLVESLARPVPVLMITKGLAPGANRLEVLPRVVAREVERRTGMALAVMAVGGPCIAGELAAERDTSVLVTGPEAEVARAMGRFAAPFYHPRFSDDLVGVEICAAFKNFYALGVGAVAGRLEREGRAGNGGLMHNLAASVFAQSLRELAILVEASGGRAETSFGLAGAGDLYVTCQAGRNSRMGRLLGLGLPYAEAKAAHMPEDTVEGAQLALDLGPTLDAMLAAGILPAADLPLTCAILDAVCRDAPLVLPFARFHGA